MNHISECFSNPILDDRYNKRNTFLSKDGILAVQVVSKFWKLHLNVKKLSKDCLKKC